MTTVYLAPTFGVGYQAFTTGGLPLNAGYIYTYEAGSTTPQATYTTSAGSTANDNPIVLGADGRPPNEIWVTSSAYRFDVKDSAGNLIKTYDNIYGIGSPLSISSYMTTMLTKTTAAAARSYLGSTTVGDAVFVATSASVARTALGAQSDLTIYNVKDYGAVGNNSTDDATAINDAITAAIAGGGGIVYFPEGNYRVNSTVTVDASVGIHLMGEHFLASAINTTTDTLLLSIKGTGRHTVQNLGLYGVGISGGTGTSAGGNSHCLRLDSTCVDVYLHRLFIVGGYYGLANHGTDTVADCLVIYNNYGSAMVYQDSGALWMRRCKVDNPWPNGSPSVGATFGARANSTAYSAGHVVSLSSFYLQCTSGGTSGGSAPSLANYGTNITDGTVTWKLACRTTLQALQITTGASEIHVTQSDFTGAANKAIGIDNGGAGTAPFLTVITDCVMSQAISASIDCIAGSNLLLSGNEIAPALVGGSTGAVQLRTAWTGDATITNNIFFSSSAAGIGIYIGTGTSTAITCNNFGGWAYGVLVDANVSKFIVANNNLGGSAKWGANNRAITVAAGTSDYYNIVNNIVHGYTTAGVTDGGTGVNKTISGNV